MLRQDYFTFVKMYLQKGGDPSTASATDALLRLYPDYWPCLSPLRAFGHCQLSWYDGRWVQDPRTYSTRRGWCAFTSDSNFMKANCSLQSELGPVLMGLAPPRGLATLCTGHCIMCVALDVRAMLIWRRPHLPPTCVGSLLCTFNTERGLRSFPDLTVHLTARADGNHAAPI